MEEVGLKLTLGIVLLAGCAIIFYAKFYNSTTPTKSDGSPASQLFSSSKSSITPVTSSSVSSVRSPPPMAVGSSAISSRKSLSGARVDPLPEIAHFLRQMDNANIPKIYLPVPKLSGKINYEKAHPSELKDQALAGDPYAAYRYAEYVVKRQVRTVTDKGDYAYEPDIKKRNSAMNEAREFYVRGFRGGIKSIANVLSKLYEDPSRGGSRIESLAWRRIAFAVGESERYDCLRDSTTCYVKDFNNLNRLENFYPCLSASGESCTQEEYDAAMVLAFQYADSLEFAVHNKVAY